MPSYDNLVHTKLRLLSNQRTLPGNPRFLKFQPDEHSSRALLIALTTITPFRRLDILLKMVEAKDGMVNKIAVLQR